MSEAGLSRTVFDRYFDGLPEVLLEPIWGAVAARA
jgi:hypothetical protein